MTSRLERQANGNGGHTYKLAPKDGGKAIRVPSVTAILSTLHTFTGDHADRWRVQQVAETLNARWDTYEQVGDAEAVTMMVTDGMVALHAAADFGRDVHRYCEQLWTGETVQVPSQYLGHVEQVAAWWDTQKLEVIAAETLMYADGDEWKGGPVAGQCDLLVYSDRGIGLLDIKTWKPPSKGDPRKPQWAMQLAAYADMDYLIRNDADEPMPSVDWLAVLHVGPNSVHVWEVDPVSRRKATEQVHAARHLKSLPNPTMHEMT